MTRPSAGDNTALGCDGITRGGSRKNCTMNTVTSHTGSAASHHPASVNARATAAHIATNSQPSRAIMGCGYLLFTVAGRTVPLFRRVVDALVQIPRLLLDRTFESPSTFDGGGGRRCHIGWVRRRRAHATRAARPALSR